MRRSATIGSNSGGGRKPDSTWSVFGSLPPVLCGLSFRESNDGENKMMNVADASLACIALLALGTCMSTEEPCHT